MARAHSFVGFMCQPLITSHKSLFAFPSPHVAVIHMCACSTTLEFFNFANPLTQSEILQWDNYGDTAATRGTGVDTTLIVKSAVVGEAGTGR